MTHLKLSLFLILLTSSVLSGQVAIPDSNFEQALIDLGHDTDGTLNGQISNVDAEAVLSLDVSGRNIADLTGIEGFTNLIGLVCNDNLLSTLDISNNLSLVFLFCQFNQLTSLDVSNNLALDNLTCSFNQIAELDVSNNLALSIINCDDNLLTTLDLSNNANLTRVNCAINELVYLDLRNGNNAGIPVFFSRYNPNLFCILVDDVDFANANWVKDAQATFTNDPNDSVCLPPPVPTLSEWALIILGLCLGIVGVVALKDNLFVIRTPS